MPPWQGEGPILLDTVARHLVVVNAVTSGRCGVFDTISGELVPIATRAGCD